MPDAAGALYRVSIGYTVANEECVNVLYMRARNIGNSAAGICLDIRDNWITQARPLCATQTVFRVVQAVEVVRLGAQDSWQEGFSFAGTNVAALAEAPQLAVCVQVRTGQAGRSRRGRFFLGGIPDTHVEQGRILATPLNGLNTWLDFLTTRYCGDSFTGAAQLGVFSRTRYGILTNPFDAYWVPARSLALNAVMSTMRSRKPAAA